MYQDRLSGLSWSKMSFKYNLNIKTIHTIVKRLEEEAKLKSESNLSPVFSENTNSNQQ
jgi:hypothetical protein